jgi:hypothetical protein
MVDFTSHPYRPFGRLPGSFARAPLVPNNLISDLENAIATRSAEAGAMLQQITDLFLLNVGHYSAEQLDVYDGVLNELIANVEVAARVKLAQIGRAHV